MLRRVKARGADVEFVDTAQFTDKTRIEAYSRVALPVVYRLVCVAPHSMFADFAKLCFMQRRRTLPAVRLVPPFEKGRS
jgi:hypothetical protein